MERTPRTLDEKLILFRNADTLKEGIVFLSQILNHPTCMQGEMPTQGMIILRDLLENHSCTLDRLVDQIWGSEENGGPLGAERQVRVTVSRLRDKLKPDWMIIAAGRSYRLVHVAQRDWLSLIKQEKAETW